METVVTIPDNVFEEAERLASRLMTSRGQLYTRALAEFLAWHDEDRGTATFNRVVDEVGTDVDDCTRKASYQTMRRVERS